VGDFRNTSNANVDNDGDFAGRLFPSRSRNTDIAALQNLGFGVAGSSGNVSRTAAGLPSTTGGTLPGYTTDGQQQFFAYNPATGVAWRTACTGAFAASVLLLRAAEPAWRICDPIKGFAMARRRRICATRPGKFPAAGF